MSSRKRTRGNALRQDPGPSPTWSRAKSEVLTFAGPHQAETKTIQLCRQVEEAISCALACSTNPILRDLLVLAVEPARGAAALRVLVAAEGEVEPHQVEEALTRARGYFRGEVACAIHRKRVPSLDFTLMPQTFSREVDQ